MTRVLVGGSINTDLVVRVHRAPEGGETLDALQTRAVAGVNRAVLNPAEVLIVAHGALFRAIRRAMGVDWNRRTQNAVPMRCAPSGEGWTIE